MPKKYDIVLSWQAAVLFGIFLRLLLFIMDDSLWRDEANLLMGLYSVPISDLMKELPFNQRAPIALAILWKTMIVNLSGSTHLMRLPSLVVGISQLIVFSRIIKIIEIRKNSILVILVWIFAVSPNLVLFSNQVKPYIFDVFCSTLLIYLSLPFFLSENHQLKDSVVLILASWSCLFFSYPSSFVVLGVCLALIFNSHCRKTGVLLVSGSLIIIFSIYIASGESSDYLQNYWNKHYPTTKVEWWVIAFAQTLFWGLSSPNFLSFTNLFKLFAWLYIPVCALGVFELVRMRRYSMLLLLLSPSIFCIVASVFHKYPYGNRLILFLMPQVHLFLVFGLVYIMFDFHYFKFIIADNYDQSAEFILAFYRDKLLKIIKFGFWAVVIICLTVSIAEYTYPITGVKSGLDYIASNEEKNDIVIVGPYASQVVKYYKLLSSKNEYVQFPKAQMFMPEIRSNKEGWSDPKQVFDTLPPASRIWIIAESTGYHREIKESYSPDIKIIINELSALRDTSFHLELNGLWLFGVYAH